MNAAPWFALLLLLLGGTRMHEDETRTWPTVLEGRVGAAGPRGVQVELPLREVVLFEAPEPVAASYAVTLAAGRRLVVELVPVRGEAPPEGAEARIDLFRWPDEVDEASSEVAIPGELVRSERTWSLVHEAHDTGRVLVQVAVTSPAVRSAEREIETHARFELTLRDEPILAFPVKGKDRRAIQSFFGAPRDRGARSHHGIDIFAAQGTRAVAAADARVIETGTSRRGGNVVWLYDETRGFYLYYAHLDRQLVEPGDRVRAGDPVGLVGNTGNARYGAPHLHFGIYRRGPIDPYPFVGSVARKPTRVTAKIDGLGYEHRVVSSTAKVRSVPTDRGKAIAKIPRGTPVLPFAARGAWVLVRLPDDTIGWMLPRTLARTAASPRQRGGSAPRHDVTHERPS